MTKHDKIIAYKYAIRHIPSGMFVDKYENEWKTNVKGANNTQVCLAIPTFTKVPRFYKTESSAQTVISRITRTTKDNRDDKTRAILYGTENALDYEVVRINVYWDYDET